MKKSKKKSNNLFNRKKILFIILLFVFFNLTNLNAQTNAQTLDHISEDSFNFIPKSNDYDINENNQIFLSIMPNLSILVFTYNNYYNDLFYIGAINKEPDNILYVYDNENFYEFPFFDNELNVIPYNQNYKKFQLNNKIKEVVFCNFNKKCENNNDNLLENNLICSDCEKGQKDNYCDISFDNICDEDCFEYDYDCGSYSNEKNKEFIDAVYETCEVFAAASICNLNQTCTGNFINVSDSNRCCIKGNCIDQDFKKISSSSLKNISLLTIFILLLIIILIFFIKKNKLIVISVILILFTYSVSANPPLTREEVKNKICEITALYQEKYSNYPICGNIILGFAETETGLRHWDNKGKVLVSGDGGIGIMQITGNIDNRGNSIKGHKLNVYNFEDNVEAGILEFINKCNSLECYNPSVTKHYYCENYRLLEKKDVYYSGIDLAIRYYNGWGCHAPIFRNQWIQKSGGDVSEFNNCFNNGGTMDFCLNNAGVDFYLFHNGPNDNSIYDGYGPIAKRIQSYVDLVHKNSESFIGVCPNDVKYNCDSKNNQDNKKDNNNPEKLKSVKKDFNKLLINKNGYYYLNNIYKIDYNIDLLDLEKNFHISNSLLNEIYSCIFDLKIDCSHFPEGFECINDNLEKEVCSFGKEFLVCKNPEKTFKECAYQVIQNNNIKNFFIDYCPSDVNEKKCYDNGKIYDGEKCIIKPENYDDTNIIKFCIETGEEILYYNPKQNVYEKKPINLKFALKIIKKNINIVDFNYDSFSLIEKNQYQETSQKTLLPIETFQEGSYQSIYESIKKKMGGTVNLYTDCTNDIDPGAWCWVHSGCKGYGIYCRKDKLENARPNYLAQLFTHEITHTLQRGCSNIIESEWGAEYYSGSNYYCFKVGDEWLNANEVAELMKKNGCTEEKLIDTSFCINKCKNPSTMVDWKGKRGC